jgi:hypothetical protein
LLSCCLLWIPVRLDAIPNGQREWLLEFFSKISAQLNGMDLRGEHFMQMQTIDENPAIRDMFLNGMLKEAPLVGVSRQRHQPEVAIPDTADIEAFAKKKREFRPYDYMQSNACWFLNQDDEQLRQKYLGYGGLTVLYRKKDQKNEPDKATPMPTMPLIVPKFLRRDPQVKLLLEGFDPNNPRQIPAFLRNHAGMKQVFSSFEPDKMQEKSDLLLSPFRGKSKEIFGEDLPRDLKFESLPFIVPRLSSQDFFAHTDPQVRRWFELFEVYIAESPVDAGIIMACKDNLTPLIATILDEMRGNGYRYWEG